MKIIPMIAAVLTAFALSAHAGLDEGMAGLQRGDYAAALKEFRALAERRDAAAEYNLGRIYDHGWGVPQDDKEAVAWYRKAADQGYVAAQYNLGMMYAEGRGVPQDYQQAAAWFWRAADQGNASAQINLGAMYAEGRGVPQKAQGLTEKWKPGTPLPTETKTGTGPSSQLPREQSESARQPTARRTLSKLLEDS
jgi:TPR repeat protein